MVFWGQSGKWWVSCLPISCRNGAFVFLGNFGSINNYEFLYVEFELAGGSGRGGGGGRGPRLQTLLPTTSLLVLLLHQFANECIATSNTFQAFRSGDHPGISPILLHFFYTFSYFKDLADRWARDFGLFYGKFHWKLMLLYVTS